MGMTIHRRKFLHVAGAVALTGEGLAEPRTASSPSAPMDLSAKPRLLVGCCAYSYAKHLKAGRMRMEDFIRKGVELELHGLDITAYWLKSTDPSYLLSLRHLAFRNGLPLSGAATSTNMCQPDPAKRAEEVEKIKKWVDATACLGASHLRVFGGEIPKGATVEQAIQWVVTTMKPACDYASQKGVTLGIESHGGITGKAAPIIEILRGVDSPYAGCNLDISNFSADDDEEQYTQIEACIPYATHTHIRDRFSESGHPIDLDRVFRLFARGGYKGYMSAEYEGEEDPDTGVPKLVEKIRALCRKYSSV